MNFYSNNIRGQLTASAVSAIDFAWHVVKDDKTGFVLNVAEIDRDKPNVTPSFWTMLHSLNTTGRCWVSNFCFPPKELLSVGLEPLMKSKAVSAYLHVFYDTVVKSVKTSNDLILSVEGIQRTPLSATCEGYDYFLSQDLEDWLVLNNSIF